MSFNVDEEQNPFAEEVYFEGELSYKNWARTRRQRIMQHISFESDVHDIYDPKYSSDEDSETGSTRMKAEEVSESSFNSTFELLKPDTLHLNIDSGSDQEILINSQSDRKSANSCEFRSFSDESCLSIAEEEVKGIQTQSFIKNDE